MVVLFYPLLLVIFLAIFSLLQISYLSIGTDPTRDFNAYGQRDPSTGEYHRIESIDSKTNLCPPGYIVDESGYCNADIISVIPDVTSSEEGKNISQLKKLNQKKVK